MHVGTTGRSKSLRLHGPPALNREYYALLIAVEVIRLTDHIMPQMSRLHECRQAPQTQHVSTAMEPIEELSTLLQSEFCWQLYGTRALETSVYE